MSPCERGVVAHSVLLMLAGSVVVAAGGATSTEVECHSPFAEVGGHCVHLDHSVTGNWTEMRQYCQELGGDLVNLGDVQFYEDILTYIRVLNLPRVHFWIGASDQEQEGYWIWTDRTPVKMGTPFWANYGSDNIQMPAGGSEQNCAVLDVNLHYYFNDYDCESSTKCPICENTSIY